MAVPNNAFLVLDVEMKNIDINNNLLGWASRDGGTTWFQVTLSKYTSSGNRHILVGEVEFTDDPGQATALRWKVTTVGPIWVKVHNAALEANVEETTHSVDFVGAKEKRSLYFVSDLIAEALPTSDVGLPEGSIWNDGGSLRYVPINRHLFSFGDTLGTGRNGEIKNVTFTGMKAKAITSWYDSHRLAIMEDGTLWGYGDNRYGELGLGHTNDRKFWTQISSRTDWEKIEAGWNTTYAITSGGEMYACGDNSYGQLGVWSFEHPILNLTKVYGDGWAEVRAGARHAVALKTDGTIWTVGVSSLGLPVGREVSVFTQITETDPVSSDNDWVDIGVAGAFWASQYAVWALKSDGTLWSCGYQNYTGSGTTTTLLTQLETDVHSIWLDGISSLHYVKTDGTMWGLGENRKYQLGVGNNTDALVPEQVPGTEDWTNIVKLRHTNGGPCSMALRSDGTIWGAGYNSGNVNLPFTDTASVTAWTQLGTGTNWKDFALFDLTNMLLDQDDKLYVRGHEGTYSVNEYPAPVHYDTWDYCCAGVNSAFLIKDGELWSAGYNSEGILGYGSNDHRWYFERVGTDNDWVDVAAGLAHTVAIKADGTVWICGAVTSGQMGSVPSTNLLTNANLSRSYVKAFAKDSNTLLLADTGQMWATGYNQLGQLGLGHNTDVHQFTQVGSTFIWKTAATYRDHSLAVRDDGTLWATGDNSYGQLGTGDNVSKNIFTQIGTDNDWAKVSCGCYHSMALKDNGDVYACGRNDNFQLGTGDSVSVSSFVKVASECLDIQCGLISSLIVGYDSSLWSVGSNSNGQLGDKTKESSTEFTKVLTGVSSVSITGANVMALVRK